jgi:hypothetical protein
MLASSHYDADAAIDIAACKIDPKAVIDLQKILPTANQDASVLGRVAGDLTSCPSNIKPVNLIVSIFPKRNLPATAVQKLRAVLPSNYNLRIGAGVGSDYDADALFVDRDWVPVASIIQVLQALQTQGVSIKYILQLPLRRAEIQIGTAVYGEAPPGTAIFEKLPPLNLEQLATLTGPAFWKAAMNGAVWCQDAPLHPPFECHLSDDARPVR